VSDTNHALGEIHVEHVGQLIASIGVRPRFPEQRLLSELDLVAGRRQSDQVFFQVAWNTAYHHLDLRTIIGTSGKCRSSQLSLSSFSASIPAKNPSESG
jgi:hypothetical protein